MGQALSQWHQSDGGALCAHGATAHTSHVGWEHADAPADSRGAAASPSVGHCHSGHVPGSWLGIW